MNVPAGAGDPRVRVVPDAAALAAEAAALFAASADRAIAARGEFHCALPGGRSVRGMLGRLARAPFADTVNWKRVVIYFADERAVPPVHEASNYRLVREALLDPLGERAPRCERMRGEVADLAAEAHDYAALLEAPLDLVVLGLGEDGHVASLFPGSPLLGSTRERAAAVLDSPKPPDQRLTLTPRALDEARELLVLASGGEKAAAARSALALQGAESVTPARLARVARATWLLDEAAAASLAR
ncbi:MAG: 6-phosphogluconolactonase [Candidatus Eisenbacteria bacterium]